ncbi:hypothetical protein [Leptolyngbya sp. FACHB-711]|jgi:hypothetical protein|uniref:hypothetical protein n=1 Tax=unclassified Leptolyngbya TaxID=2650499 RepID=UPI001684F72C|nr:hypothetical protein [Leptolyngbya sp. FACHB-711]MBD1851220.1 hypothetical protein [Cyanobacteria bacterium FACHB-502]MBD2027111.1 hypothetical protein [Leptolyngbya sp. FACHB-711]
MTSPSSAPASFSDDLIWDNLKQAITASSGFHRWQAERSLTFHTAEQTLDQLVSRYLRETLETLAY